MKVKGVDIAMRDAIVLSTIGTTYIMHARQQPTLLEREKRKTKKQKERTRKKITTPKNNTSKYKKTAQKNKPKQTSTESITKNRLATHQDKHGIFHKKRKLKHNQITLQAAAAAVWRTIRNDTVYLYATAVVGLPGIPIPPTNVDMYQVHVLWYGLGRPVINPKIGHWSVVVLFGWRFAFGIMKYDGREPPHRQMSSRLWE